MEAYQCFMQSMKYPGKFAMLLLKLMKVTDSKKQENIFSTKKF